MNAVDEVAELDRIWMLTDYDPRGVEPAPIPEPPLRPTALERRMGAAYDAAAVGMAAIVSCVMVMGCLIAWGIWKLICKLF